MSPQDNIIAAIPRKVYSNAHAYHIHSISVNSDQETYISADDLRINLWNLNISDQSFSKIPYHRYGPFILTPALDIVDIKPVNMEELTEVITATEFHPSHCNQFMYSSSKSNIKLADMREAALCDAHAKCQFNAYSLALSLIKRNHQALRKKKIRRRVHSSLKSYRLSPMWNLVMMAVTSSPETIYHWRFGMSTWRASLSKLFLYTTIYVASFVTCTKMIASLTNLNAYGVAMTSECMVYQFRSALMMRHRHVLTGSYHNYFRIYDTDTLNDVVLQADKSAFKAKKVGGPLPGAKNAGKNGAAARGLRDAMQLDTLDFNKKILHASWHPRENTIAVWLPSATKFNFLTEILLRLPQPTISSYTAQHDACAWLPHRDLSLYHSHPYALRLVPVWSLFTRA